MKIIIFFICTVYLSHSDSSNCPKIFYRINKQKRLENCLILKKGNHLVEHLATHQLSCQQVGKKKRQNRSEIKVGVGVHPTLWKITWSDSSAVQRDHILWSKIERNLRISSSMQGSRHTREISENEDKAENQFCHHLWALGCPYVKKKKGPAFCGKKNCTDSETLPETICPLHPKKKFKLSHAKTILQYILKC